MFLEILTVIHVPKKVLSKAVIIQLFMSCYLKVFEVR